MEDLTSLACKQLKHALTPKTTNSGQNSEEKRAEADLEKTRVLIAVVRDMTSMFMNRELTSSAQGHMRRIRQHRLRLAGLENVQMADETTLEAQKEIVKVYSQHPPGNINKLSEDMGLLLVQLTQRWSDKEFVAALNSSEILGCVDSRTAGLTTQR